MSVIDITYFVTILIAALSFLSTIAAWFFLSSINVKLNLIEQEIEKRFIEFDQFKKEKANLQNLPPATSVIESTEPVSIEDDPVQDLSNGNSIQVYRNVKGTFEHSRQPTGEIYNSDQQRVSFEKPAIKTDSINKTEYCNEMDEVPFSESTFLPPPPLTPIDQLHHASATIQKNGGKDSPDIENRKIILKLYSDKTKDADFETLWQRITQSIQNYSNPHIEIDFSNINFLYEKEVDYLQKINYFILNQGGSLSLINCENDLLSLINKKNND